MSTAGRLICQVLIRVGNSLTVIGCLGLLLGLFGRGRDEQSPVKRCRHLVFVLGDQLDEHSTALADLDPATDIVLMAEVPEESSHVRSSKARTAFFFAAMRHFAGALEEAFGSSSTIAGSAPTFSNHWWLCCRMP